MSASSVVIIVILMLGILLNIIMRSKTMNLEKAFIWGVAISVRFFLFNLIRWIRLSVRECRK